jgi:hypothetical protein
MIVRIVYSSVNISSITLNVGAPTFFSQTKDLARSFPTPLGPRHFARRAHGLIEEISRSRQREPHASFAQLFFDLV